METPSSARRQALRQGADSNKVQVRKEIALSKYYSIARRLLDSFTAAFDDRSLDEAYIYGVRFVSLCVESFPKHPSYRHRSYAMQHKEMSDKCSHVLECLEIVRQRMDAEEILREQQRQQELKEQAERQRAEEAELEARREQQKEESERQETTKTKLSALAKLSAMQRDLNQPTNNVARTEKKESAPTVVNQTKKTGLIRAQVVFGESDSSFVEETPEPANETTNDAAKTSSFMGSAMSRMTSMVSRAPKTKETSEKPSEGTKTKLVPAQIMDSSQQPVSTSQVPKLVVSEVKRQKPHVDKTNSLHSVPEKKKGSSKGKIPASIDNTQQTKSAKTVAKKQKPTTEKSKAPPAIPGKTKTKSTSEKKTSKSSKKTNTPSKADKPAVKPKPSKQESTPKTKTPSRSQKQDAPRPVKHKDKPTVQTQKEKPIVPAPAPRKDIEVEPVQPKPNVAPPMDTSAMEVDKVEEAVPDKQVEIETINSEPPVQLQRRPEQDTIDLLEASIAGQLERIEEIEQKLIPKLLEQARKEHQIAKTSKMPKQERMLHKRKAIHCVSQKRKWEKLAETTISRVLQDRLTRSLK